MVFLTIISDGLLTALQTQRQSAPAVDWQPQKSEYLGEPYLGRQKLSHAPIPVQYPLLVLVQGPAQFPLLVLVLSPLLLHTLKHSPALVKPILPVCAVH